MKHLKLTIVSLVTILFSIEAFSQNYVEEITQEVCECTQGASDEGKTIEEIKLELVYCMIEASDKYKKKLKKDHKIDLDSLEEGDMGKLGELIGAQMASTCPKVIMALIAEDDSELEKAEDVQNVKDVEESQFSGEILNVEDSKFLEFSVKNEKGKTVKFYWLTFVESDIDLTTDYKTLTGKTVDISYIQKEFFDSRIGEYKIYNVIQSIKLNQ